MPAWLGPLIQGVAAVGGGILGNRANRQTARESMAFSERMASTQAQRSAKDYQAAGLNPALAYDRPAAAPGGSVAQQEDVIGKGISSGRAAEMQRMQMQLMEEQVNIARNQNAASYAEGQIALAKAAPWQSSGEGSLRDLYAKAESSRLRQEMALQPHHLRSAELQKLMQEYGMSKGQAEQAYYRLMGPAAIGIDQLSGPAAGILGAGVGALALLRKGATAARLGSSAQGVRGMFKPPVQRRTGDWERINKNRGGKPPRGI